MKSGISEFNPPLRARKHRVADKLITVIRDDYLPAGTKQRYLPLYLSQPKFADVDEFIYAGSSDGYGQIGLAYAAKLLGKKATIFVQRFDKGESKQTKMARSYGATIKGPYRKRIQDLIAVAEKYISHKPVKRSWGLATSSKDTEAVDMLGSQIMVAYEASRKRLKSLGEAPGKIFVTGGTAIIYTALKAVFPRTKFVIVQVGKKIWPDQIFPGDEVFISPMKFPEIPPPERRPPYPAALNYDAKVFDAVSELGKDGDWIWNIAGN